METRKGKSHLKRRRKKCKTANEKGNIGQHIEKETAW
jgi:hypothetical protein